jgi:hypothetical protein
MVDHRLRSHSGQGLSYNQGRTRRAERTYHRVGKRTPGGADDAQDRVAEGGNSAGSPFASSGDPGLFFVCVPSEEQDLMSTTALDAAMGLDAGMCFDSRKF